MITIEEMKRALEFTPRENFDYLRSRQSKRDIRKSRRDSIYKRFNFMQRHHDKRHCRNGNASNRIFTCACMNCRQLTS